MLCRVRESAERATDGAARVAARADADAREAVQAGSISHTEAELLRMKVCIVCRDLKAVETEI